VKVREVRLRPAKALGRGDRRIALLPVDYLAVFPTRKPAGGTAESLARIERADLMFSGAKGSSAPQRYPGDYWWSRTRAPEGLTAAAMAAGVRAINLYPQVFANPQPLTRAS